MTNAQNKTVLEAERDAIIHRQAEQYALSEASRLRPKFRTINDVKIYMSLKDFYND